MTAIKSLAKETLIYGLSYSLGRVINFLLVTFYLTSYLFIAKDGSIALYQDLYFYIALFLGILTLRMETSFFRFVSKEEYSKGLYAMLSQLVFFACVFFIVFFIVFKKPILIFLKYPAEYGNVLFIACCILILDVLSSLPFAKLRYDKRPLKYAWIKLVGIFVNIVLVLFIFEIYFNSNEVQQLSSSEKIYYILIANVIGSLLTLVFLFQEIKESFKRANWNYLKPIMIYSWPLILVTLIYTIIQNGYTSFLKYLLPGTNVENLSNTDDLVAAVRLAVIMNIFITAFNYAVEPFFFRHSGQKDARKTYASINLVFTIACCAIYIMTCLNVDLVSLLVGKEYRSAIHLLPILLLSNIFSGIFSNMSSWYKLNDKTLEAALISLSGLFLNTILFIILVPIYGKDAAAWISLIVYFLMTVISYIQGQKHYYIPYNIKKVGGYLLCSVLIVYIFNNYLNNLISNHYYNFGLSLIFVSILLYVAYTFEWKQMKQSEALMN
ncbi:MAG: polysaccharide biosynthesis C-terminal domain-containing protein [Saprospiraceae bacterium]